MSAILLKAVQKHIGMKVVGMVGRCTMAKEFNDNLKEREVVRQSDGTNTKAHTRLNEEVSRPMTDA